MTTRAVEAVDQWDSEPFRGGYRSLHDLADADFSGVVVAGAAKLCMLNGTAVGVLDGTVEDFEDAAGTVYEAPSPALPLLALMQERNEGVRGKYYSEDTSLSEVDDTLADGGFTGYVELSENVLSGDYYVVYHRGRSMAVAWVGNSNQLLTDDEAFGRADDEVGIFQVRPAEIEPVEIPEADDAETAGAAGVGGGADDTAGSEPDDDPTAESASASAAAADEPDTVETAADDPGTSESAVADAPSADDPEPPAADGPDADADDSPDVTGTATDGRTKAGAATTGGEADGADASGSSPTADRTSDAETTAETGERDDTSERGDTSERDDGATAAGRSGDGATAAGRSDDAADRSESVGRTDRDDRGSESADRSERSRRRARNAERGRSGPSDREPGSERSGSARGTDRSREREASTSRREPEGSARSEPDASADRSDPRSADGARPEAAGSSDAPSGGTASTDAAGVDDRRPPSGVDESGAPAGAAAEPDRLETRSIPSLDPSKTTSPGGADDDTDEIPSPPDPEPTGTNGGQTTDRTVRTEADEGRASGRGETRTDTADPRPREGGNARGTDASPETERTRDRAAASTDGDTARAADPRADERVADLEAQLDEREVEIERLEADLADAETDLDDLQAELADVRAERDDLRERLEEAESERDRLRSERDELESEAEELAEEVERLQSRVDQVESEYGAAVDADRRLSPAEALEQTNLFVRYESKGEATLESAHSGEAGREEVGANLGLEYHTQFDAGNVSVGGRAFDEFLRETIQFRFVTWVIHDLLYEIRDTGKVAALEDLYDAIPKIDRAELNGVVSVEYTEEGQQRRTQESFDVVMRDRMGNPLLTANLNDSRQAASESMMSSLVTASSRVGESTDTLAASLLVTASFFEPEALETAAEATSGGLLSRDKRESFVKLSRKRGYHLCLVEAREDKFHLAVPEL